MANTFLQGLAGGLQGLAGGLENRYQRKRQKELDALDRARLESALATAELERSGMRETMTENARQRALLQQTPEQMMGEQVPPAGVPWVPTPRQSVLQGMGPLATMPVEQGAMLDPYIRRAQADEVEARKRQWEAEDRSRMLGSVSPELQRITGFSGSPEELSMAEPFLLQKGEERMAALKVAAKNASGPEKIRENIAVQDEFRNQLSNATLRRISDAAVENPKLREALDLARTMSATTGRPIDPAMVFDRMAPEAANALRSQAAAEAALSTLALLPGTAQQHPQMVQSLIHQVPSGTGLTTALPRIRQRMESLYGEAAPEMGFTYSSPETLLYGGPVEPAPEKPPPVSLPQAPVASSVDGVSQQEYLQFRVGEGASPEEAEEEWQAYVHASKATAPKKGKAKK